MALGGCDDYGLLITAGAKTMQKVLAAFDPPPALIGEITEGPAGDICLLNARGKKMSHPPAGWDHFKSKL